MADFISFEDAKNLLGVSDKDLHSFIAQGKLSPMRDGGAVQFPNDEVESLRAERGDGVELDMGGDDGLVLDFGTDVADLAIEEPNSDEISFDTPEDDSELVIEEIAEEEEEIIIEEEPLDETTDDEPILNLDDEISLEAPEEESILLEDEDDEEEAATIVLSDDDDDDDASETIMLSDDDEEDTIMLADDDSSGTETISLADDDDQDSFTVAIDEDEMIGSDDDIAVEMAGGGQMAALPEGAYVVQEMPPSMLVMVPLIIGLIILLFGGMILYPMVNNASPELGAPTIPSYLTGLAETVRNW